MKNSFDSIRALAYNMMQRVRSQAVQYPAAQTMGLWESPKPGNAISRCANYGAMGESEAGQCNIPLRKLWGYGRVRSRAMQYPAPQTMGSVFGRCN